MADADIGRLKATVELDPTKLEQGVIRAEKSLGELDTTFLKTQQNISGAIRNLSGSISKNSEQIHRSTTYIKDSITNQTRTISSKLDKLNNDINKSNKAFAKATQQTSKTVVDELKRMLKQYEIMYAFSQKDMSVGFKKLEQAIRQTALQSTKSLRTLQSQANGTYNSLGKLSKATVPNVMGTINLGANTLSRTSAPNVSIAPDLKQATVNADGLYVSLTKTWHTLSNISFQVYLFQQGIQQVSNLLSTFVSPGWEFAKSMETNEIGMAGILSSMTTLNDKELEWNQALSISKQIIKELNAEAVRTAATSEELVGTYRALLAPALGAGFSLEQVKEFTVVGVNAVKSMGLEGRQLIQELRDLVQGGIQTASSTLATSLGLTDRDIKEAKESSEGLFKFLMDRLSGFKHSADATSQSIKGLESIVGEGYVLASAQGFQPLLNEYQKILQQIADAMFDTTSFQVRPEFVQAFREASEYALKLFRAIKSVIEVLTPVGELVIDILVPSFKVLAEYAEVIATSLMAFGVIKKIDSVMGGNNQTPTTTTPVVNNEAITQATKDYEELRNSALKTGKDIVDSHNRTQVAYAVRRETIANINALEKKGNKELADSVRGLYKQYKDLGFSSREASQLQNEASKIAVQGNKKLYDSIVGLTIARAKEANETKKHLLTLQEESLKREELARKVGILTSHLQATGTALASAGALVKVFADEESELANKVADVAIQAGTVAYTFGTLIQSIPTLSEGIGKLITKLKALTTVMAVLQVVSKIGVAGIIAGSVAMATGAIHSAVTGQDFSLDAILDKMTDTAEKAQARKEAEIKRTQEQLRGNTRRTYGGENSTKNVSDGLKAKNLSEQDSTVSNSLLRSQYKALEQQLKLALEPLKELQKEYDHYYKYDIIATQTYIDEKYKLQQLAIQKEIENLEERKRVAKEAKQEADVENFDAQIARLKQRSENLQNEKARNLADEYKKLDDRLAGIRGKYESLVGVSDKAFKANLVREYADEIVRITAELKVASDKVVECTDANKTEELKLWETRKQSNAEALKQLTEIISLKKMERDATEALAEAERINLEIREKSLSIQSQANNMSISPLNAESQMYEMKKERLDEYIDHYTTAIARYEAMSEKAFNEGDISTSNKFKQMAIEAREALYELMDSLHPLEKAIKEQFIGSLSDMFQSMLWQEKTAKEALKDFAKSIMQTFTKQVFDNFASQIAGNLFSGLTDKTEVNNTINAKKKANGTQGFLADIITMAGETRQALVPSFEVLTQTTTELTNAMQMLINRLYEIPNTPNNPNAPTTPEGGGGGSNLLGGFGNFGGGGSGEGSKPTVSIGDITLPDSSMEGINDLSDQANDATISLGSLTKSTKATTSATDENTGATASDTLATATMVTTMLNATGVLGKFGTVLQGVMMAMQIAKSAGILGFASGGYVQGEGTATSDSIPARLSDGEYVLRAGVVRQLGVGFLDQLNNIDRGGVRRSSRLPKFAFAEGGLVNAKVQEDKSSTQPVDGNTSGSSPTVVMQMTFQSLDPEANMKLMEAQYPQIRSRLIRDLQNNSSVRTAVKGATK